MSHKSNYKKENYRSKLIKTITNEDKLTVHLVFYNSHQNNKLKVPS